MQAYDMKRVVELPQDYDAMREVLEREEKEEDIDRNAWKRSEWRDGEDLGVFCNAPMPAPLGPARGPSLPSDITWLLLGLAFSARRWRLGRTMLPQLAHLKMMSFIVYAELSLEALALPICRALGTSPCTGG